jgi:hypothetical protein
MLSKALEMGITSPFWGKPGRSVQPTLPGRVPGFARRERHISLAARQHSVIVLYHLIEDSPSCFSQAIERIQRVTGEQMRQARALLGWSSDELAKAAGVGVATIWRAEARRGAVKMLRATAAAVEQALRDAGVELLKDGGVRKRRRR